MTDKDNIHFVRIMYKGICKESSMYPEYSFYSGEFLGYPESDEHFKKRILKAIEESNTNNTQEVNFSPARISEKRF